MPSGNARVTYSDANNDGVVGVNDIKQVNHYYPYGLNMEGNWNGSYADAKNKYQYNGKEWNDDFGLGWNHHDWRFYDVAMARFVTVDRLPEEGDQENFSPYHFSYDNPVRFNDPDGQCPICVVFIIAALVTTAQPVANTGTQTPAADYQAYKQAQNQSAKETVMALVPGGKQAGASATVVLNAAKKTATKAVVKSAATKTYQTYTKHNPTTGETYSGKTSGTGTPRQNVKDRDSGHHKNKDGFGPAKLDKSSSNADAIRGREQQMIDHHGGAQSGRGTSGNPNRGVGPNNKKAAQYDKAATKEFGKL